MPEATLNRAAVPGWYGKLPHLGDFASRRLPASFVRPWDRWLQRGLSSARGELGEGWRDVYLVAPILRFWLAPDVLDGQGWAGLLMPSVDRVGRHFPLTIAQPVAALAAALVRCDWFGAVDAAARRALDVDYNVDDLEHALVALAKIDTPAPDAAAERLAGALQGRCPTPARSNSIWWTGDAGDGAEFRCFALLPPSSAFASLLGAAP